jgi:hypothetical protein
VAKVLDLNAAFDISSPIPVQKIGLAALLNGARAIFLIETVVIKP